MLTDTEVDSSSTAAVTCAGPVTNTLLTLVFLAMLVSFSSMDEEDDRGPDPRHADLNSQLTSRGRDFEGKGRHNARVGMIVVMPMSA